MVKDKSKKRKRNKLKKDNNNVDLADLSVDAFFSSELIGDGDDDNIGQLTSIISNKNKNKKMKLDNNDEINNKKKKNKKNKINNNINLNKNKNNNDDDSDDNYNYKKNKKINKKKKNNNDNDSDSDSDDDNIDFFDSHKDDLKSLKKEDPEFFEFLKENDQGLLEFDDDDLDLDIESDDDDDDDDEDEDDDKLLQKLKKNKDQIIITKKLWEKLKNDTFESKSLKKLKRLIGIYFSACKSIFEKEDINAEDMYMGDDGPDNMPTKEELKKGKKKKKKIVKKYKQKYKIESTDLLEIILKDILEESISIFRNLLNIPDDVNVHSPFEYQNIENNIHWNKIKIILSNFFRATLIILREIKDSKILSYFIAAFDQFLPLLIPFKRLYRNYLRVFLNHWIKPLYINSFRTNKEMNINDDTIIDEKINNNNNDNNDTNKNAIILTLAFHSFCRIRQMALVLPFPFIEDVLKGIYLHYIRNIKLAKNLNSDAIVFMLNSISEAYQLDLSSSYQHAFIYIRQLAISLRSAIIQKTKQKLQLISNWQFFHSVKVWTSVICSLSNENNNLLKSLIYPLSQIIFGVLKLFNTNEYLPLRIHYIRLLHLLSASTKVHCPTVTYILDILISKEFIYMQNDNDNLILYDDNNKNKKKNKKKKLKKLLPPKNSSMPNLPILNKLLKLKKNSLLFKKIQDILIMEIIQLLNEEIEIYKYNIAFPEYSFFIIKRLREFTKKTFDSNWKKLIINLIHKIENISEEIRRNRANIDESPMTINGFEYLLPSNELNALDRLKNIIKNDNNDDEKIILNQLTISKKINNNNNNNNNNINKKLNKNKKKNRKIKKKK